MFWSVNDDLIIVIVNWLVNWELYGKLLPVIKQFYFAFITLSIFPFWSQKSHISDSVNSSLPFFYLFILKKHVFIAEKLLLNDQWLLDFPDMPFCPFHMTFILPPTSQLRNRTDNTQRLAIFGLELASDWKLILLIIVSYRLLDWVYIDIFLKWMRLLRNHISNLGWV